MPATQDAYARAFAANAAKKAGTPAAPSAPVPLPAPAPAGSPQQNMTGANALPTLSFAPGPMQGANAKATLPMDVFNIQGGGRFAGNPSSGIHMGGQAIPPGVAAVTQALMRQGSPQQNMQGPNAQPTLGDLGGDIFGIKAKQAAALAAMQPPAPPPAAPVAPPQPPGNWARQFFGSGMGSPSYGPGNAMAKLNGWAQQNPQGVQRWADAGHVPVPTMMPQQRRTGAAGR